MPGMNVTMSGHRIVYCKTHEAAFRLAERLDKHGVHTDPRCAHGEIISGPGMPEKPCVCGLRALLTEIGR